MKKIGIMGGTFNPIHVGHVEIAKASYEQYELDEVWFMPNHIPAYKSEKNIVSGSQRLKMVELAIMDYPYFNTSDFEIKREGKTYSYETFTLLKDMYPDYSFFFIMGADSLFYFEKWMHPEIILKYSTVLVAARDENGIDEINERIKLLEESFGNNNFYVVNCNSINCSSSKLREYLHDPDSDMMDYIKKYIPQRVLKYIEQNHLYKE